MCWYVALHMALRPAAYCSRCDGAQLFCRYALDDIYESSTKPALLRQAPFPVSHVFAWSRRREVLAHLAAVGMTDLPWVKLQATAAYASLAELMVQRPDKSRVGSTARKGGSKKFFMGNTPCSLDAKVWGHLASIQDTPAWQWASRHSALKQLYRRVTDTWFTNVGDLPQYLHVPVTGIHKHTAVGKNYFTMLSPPKDALRTPTLPATDDTVIASKVKMKVANHNAAIDRAGPPPETSEGVKQRWWNSSQGRWLALGAGAAALSVVAALGYIALSRTPSVILPDESGASVQIDAAAAAAAAAAVSPVPVSPRTVVASPFMLPSSMRTSVSRAVQATK